MTTRTPALAALLDPVLTNREEPTMTTHHDCPLCAMREAADSELMTALLPTVSLTKTGA